MKKLSFDGKGINDKSSEYSPRIATFVDGDAARDFGPLFEAAPEMLQGLKDAVFYLEYTMESNQYTRQELIVRLKQVIASIEERA